MSARVLIPMMSEPMPRRAPTPGVATTTTTTMPATSDAAMARVRRDLFGPVDRDATRRFLERELAAQSERDADRWGFDFVREAPRRQGPGTARYAWERIGQAAAVPETYALNRMQCLKSVADVPEATATVRQEDVVVEKTLEGVVVVAAMEAVDAADEKKTKQSHITDFMKQKKLLKRRVSLSDVDSCSTSKSAGVGDAPRVKLARSTPS